MYVVRQNAWNMNERWVSQLRRTDAPSIIQVVHPREALCQFGNTRNIYPIYILKYIKENDV